MILDIFIDDIRLLLTSLVNSLARKPGLFNLRVGKCMPITRSTQGIHSQVNAQTQWCKVAEWQPSRTKHTPDDPHPPLLLWSKQLRNGCSLEACVCLGTCAPGNVGCQAKPSPREHTDANHQSQTKFEIHHHPHSESTLMRCVRNSFLDQT